VPSSLGQEGLASLRILVSWQHLAHERYSNKCGEKEGKTD